MKQINLFLRFILEMTTLFVAGWWGWAMHSGVNSYLIMIALPVFMAAAWGVFAVPGDPSRSGKTVVVTPGWLRLMLELLFFGFGTWTFFDSGFQITGFVFASLVIIHYIIWYQRIKWLFKH